MFILVYMDIIFGVSLLRATACDGIVALVRIMSSQLRPSVCLSVRPPVCHTSGSVKNGAKDRITKSPW